MEALVANRVKWSQKFVLAGCNRERVAYDQLSTTHWVAAFLHLMREEQDSGHMVYHFTLFDDSDKFSGILQKAGNAIQFCHVEQGEVAKYAQKE